MLAVSRRLMRTMGRCFESLRIIVTELTDGDKHPSRFEENDYRLAAAALLVHAAAIDGDMSARRARQAARDRSSSASISTMRRPTSWSTRRPRPSDEAVDLYHFTALLNRSLDENGARCAWSR